MAIRCLIQIPNLHTPLNVDENGVPERRKSDEDRLRYDLAHAIASGQLVLNYQPRVDLASRKIMAAEALARWPHRRRGMVPPSRFIDLAEESGLIVQLGSWALTTACLEAVSWPEGVAISVNASGAQLGSNVLLHQVRTALDQSGLAPGRLEIELTEGVLVKADIETLLTLSAIRDLGVGLALDDFGTGYASLSSLKRLPITCLKLDRSLLRGMLRHAEDTAIVRSVVAIGTALNLHIVAEGVDNEAQRAFLIELGCHQGQSFYFGRPTSAERFRAGLAQHAPAHGAHEVS